MDPRGTSCHDVKTVSGAEVLRSSPCKNEGKIFIDNVQLEEVEKDVEEGSIVSIVEHQKPTSAPAKAQRRRSVGSSTFEKFRRSSAASAAPQSGVDWRSPTFMALTLICGLASAVALHLYYSKLESEEVGDYSHQQMAIRVGTASAFITQACLVISVQTAQVQWLWRSLKRTVLSIGAIDAAFEASQTLWSFTNIEMLSQLRLASLVALVAWTLPIASIFTPATLGVQSAMRSRLLVINAPTLDISQANFYTFYAFFVSRQDETGNGLQKFLSPRTLLTRLAVATATTGEILPITPPFINATYEQAFFGPAVQCRDANVTIIDQVDKANDRRRQALSPSVREIQNYYWAYVPALEGANMILSSSTIDVANLSSVNGPANASQQLWARFPRPNESDDNLDLTQAISPQYLVCELHNASYRVNFTWINGVQSLNITNLEYFDPVPYPVNSTYSAQDEATMSYTGYMSALSSQLVGSIGFYHDLNATAAIDIQANRTYSDIDTDLARTFLLGSVNFNSFFRKNHALAGSTNRAEPYSKPRLQDMAFARNRTLEVLIQELSTNITLSLISNPLLSPPTLTNVTTNIPTNVYSYHPRNVFLAYGIALIATLLANLLGAYAFFSNGESHANSWSSIVCSTRDIHLAELNIHERRGALPLDRKVARTRIVFGVGSDDDGYWGFKHAGR